MSYRELKSYQQATAIYDLTVEFCARYVNPKSRTTDQMEQAARSGKQNIVEGTAVSKTWPQNELKLLGVARGSLGELLEDYLDFLRQRNLSVWTKEDARAQTVRAIVKGSDMVSKTDKTNTTYTTYKSYLDDPERAANMLITLINQTNYLLDRQMDSIKEQLLTKGIGLETRTQKLGRILAEREKEEQKADSWARAQIKTRIKN